MANILVVEDDDAVRGLFETVLQRAGHAVSVAANAAEGLDRLRASTIEMVITDLNMPQGNGLELISVVRHDYPATKVMVLSDEASDDDPCQDGAGLDGVEVLPKSLGVSHLLGTVNRALGCP